MGNKLVIFMLVLAIMVTCFGNGIAEDFFTTTGKVFYSVAKTTDKISDTIKWVFVGEVFEADDYIFVARYYFDDGHYCDIARLHDGNQMVDSFHLFHLVYSTNEKVTRYSAFRIADFFTPFTSFCNAQGQAIYKITPYTGHCEITATYYDYCLDYQKNPSKDGWFEQTGIEDLL